MSKTKELIIECMEARTVPNRYNKVTIHIDDPNVEDALMSFHSDDIIKFVSDNYGVEEIFSEEELQKWAEEKGFIKSPTL